MILHQPRRQGTLSPYIEKIFGQWLLLNCSFRNCIPRSSFSIAWHIQLTHCQHNWPLNSLSLSLSSLQWICNKQCSRFSFSSTQVCLGKWWPTKTPYALRTTWSVTHLMEPWSRCTLGQLGRGAPTYAEKKKTVWRSISSVPEVTSTLAIHVFSSRPVKERLLVTTAFWGQAKTTALVVSTTMEISTRVTS